MVTAAHRRIALRPLSDAIGQLAPTRARNYVTYRLDMGSDGTHLPAQFIAVVVAVAAFGDPLMGSLPDESSWDPAARRWQEP